ncbi:Pr6Pr family membrane protein [Kribbella sp. NPDC023855]|uniref:Pr6Pr family membrane protein n=1 Tax=Kribbella sp. NPDC023855 TaxID=3154698 RepID=UPI0033F92A3D
MTSAAGRVWFGVTAVVVALGIVVQLFVSGTSAGGEGFYKENPERVLNVFAYFTIQSNLLLGGTCLLLALAAGARESTWFKTLRLNGVLCIAVTGIVYHLVLAGTDELSGWASVANLIVHTATPLLGVLGWLLFGPRRRTSGQIVAWSLAFPLLWLAFTLIRGEGTGFYPYPFVDVGELGYGRALLNCLLVALLFLALAAGATLLDRRIGRQTVER